ncbi:MAG: Rieske 2Fe-2S domain-containing protein [Myxococcota bacterium]
MSEVPATGATKGHVSSVRLPHAWFVACASKELGAAPRSCTLQDTPLVLFRGEGGRPAALLDRCPHRNLPLSLGKVTEGTLQCGYHGWRFSPDGHCVAIPGLLGELHAKARQAQAFACREEDGFVWVYSTPGVEPSSEPFRFPCLDDTRYSTVRRQLRVKATMHATVENALDVPHTAFLHGGLFRTARKKHDIEVVVRRTPQMAEAEYIGEPRPQGLLGKVLAPRGGVVMHVDRFILPCVAQVEYRLGEGSHLLVTSAMTPVSDFETVVNAVVTFRLPVPGWLVRPLLTPVGLRVFRQDAEVLARQTEAILRFGGEQYASTELDVLGQQVWRLLKQASRGEAPTEELYEHRLRMRV